MAIQIGTVAAGFALTSIAQSIMVLYGVASDINDFINEHIELMKKSENTTIARTGRVIEGAKFGFGIGYIVPIAVIATGQFVLGNNLAAVGTLASAAAFSNPVAMTCAAVGAIYYGWTALSPREQTEILERLSAGLELGIELLKSIISFVIGKTKELLSAENIKEMRRFITDAAASFGKTLADVTGTLKDHVLGAMETATRTTVYAGQTVVSTATGATQTVLTTVRQALPGKKRESSSDVDE